MPDPFPGKPKALIRMLRSKLSKDDVEGLRHVFGAAPSSVDQKGVLSAPELGYNHVFDNVLCFLQVHRERIARQQASVPDLAADLLALPEAQRRDVQRSDRRFHSEPLCHFLLEQSVDAGFNQPPEARRFAQMALEIAECLSFEEAGSQRLEDLKARCHTSMANLLRISGDFPQAEEEFQRAESLLAKGTGDPLEMGYFLHRFAVLRGTQGNFDKAFQLFERTAALYRQCQEPHLLGQTLLSQAAISAYADHPEEAVPLLRQALELIDGDQHPRTLLVGVHNLIFNLSELGHWQEAEGLLNQHWQLYDTVGDRMNLIRRGWLQAMIAQTKGDWAAAEQGYRDTRDAFRREDVPIDAALASLDLAGIFAEQGRATEIQELANDLVPYFRSIGQQREALTIILLFQNAAQKKAVTVELIRSTVRGLRSLRGKA
jgi:tetratricopeptide (TPR) repeat protein